MINRLRRRLTIILTAITGCILIAVLLISLLYSINQLRLSSLERFEADSGYMIVSLYTSDDETQSMKISEALRKEKKYIISLKKDGKTQEASPPLTAESEAIISLAEKAVTERGVSYSVASYSSALSGFFPSTSPDEKRIVLEVDATESSQKDKYDYIESNVKISEVNPDSSAEKAPDGVSTIYHYSDEGQSYPAFQYDGIDYRVNSIEIMNTQTEPAVSYQLMVIEELTSESYNIFLILLGYIALALLGIALLTVGNWFLTKLVVKPTEEGLRRQTEFVAAASHELRSPLTTLRASLCAAGISDTKAQAEKYTDCALREADRMGRLISDLLILAGSDSKKWGIEKNGFDVDTLLIETHEQYESIAKEKKRKLKLELPETALGEFIGDRDRILQILSVLLDNAMEYSPEGSTVYLEAKRKNKKLHLSVIDEGNGISEKEKTRIFDRFYRTDKSRSDKNHFGLGLSVAKELAQLHGGIITVHDELSGGTRFTLTL